MNRFCSEYDYKDIESVKDEYPAASEVVEVEGGWVVFDTASDFYVWANQV